MRDLIHQEIKVGDMVAYIGTGTKKLFFGKVVNITRTGVTVESKIANNNKLSRSRSQFVKINEQLRISMEENPEYFV